jgi:hypothetical protein
VQNQKADLHEFAKPSELRAIDQNKYYAFVPDSGDANHIFQRDFLPQYLLERELHKL